MSIVILIFLCKILEITGHCKKYKAMGNMWKTEIAVDVLWPKWAETFILYSYLI